MKEIKNDCLNTKEFCETKMKQFGLIIVHYYQEIEEKEMKKVKEEMKRIEE